VAENDALRIAGLSVAVADSEVFDTRLRDDEEVDVNDCANGDFATTWL
jgi:hypothetical protein